MLSAGGQQLAAAALLDGSACLLPRRFAMVKATIEQLPFESINDVFSRLKQGKVDGSTPSSLDSSWYKFTRLKSSVWAGVVAPADERF
jgi:hypothetical protein